VSHHDITARRIEDEAMTERRPSKKVFRQLRLAIPEMAEQIIIPPKKRPKPAKPGRLKPPPK